MPNETDNGSGGNGEGGGAQAAEEAHVSAKEEREAPHATVENEAPSVHVAKQRAFHQRLLNFEQNSFGQRVPGTENEFHFTASAADIGTASVGLGVYFSMLSVFLLLLGTMLALAVPNYALMITKSKFGNNDKLVFVNASGATSTSLCSRETDEQRYSLYSIGSLGAFCSSSTASRFSCPYTCTINLQQNSPARATNDSSVYSTQCATADGQTPACGSISPCADLDADEDPQCCCSASLRYGPDQVPGVVAAMIFLSQLVYIVFLIFYYWSYTVVSQSIQGAQVTAADFSALVHNLPTHNLDRESVAKFMAHYGIVRNVVLPLTIGNYLEKEKEYDRLQMQLHEARCASIQRAKRGSENTRLQQIMEHLYDLYMHGSLKLGEHAVSKLEQKIDAVTKGLQEEERTSTFPIGKAIVTFDYEQHKTNLLLDQRVGFYDRYVRCQSTGARFRNRNLEAEVAPEPSDVRWENSNYSDFQRFMRSACSIVLLCSVLAAGAAVQYYLERERVQARREALRTDDDSVLSVRYTGIAFASAVVVTIVNFIFQYMVTFVTDFEKLLTSSKYEAKLVTRLSIAQILNAITPIFVISKSNLYDRGGLAEQAFFIQLLAGIGPDLYNLIDPERILRRHILPKYVSTQQQMDELYAPQDFVLGVHYAAVIKSVGLALLFGPMSPVSYLLGFIGVALTFCVDKYVAIKRARAPRRLTSESAESVHYILWALGLGQILITGVVYFPSKPYNPYLWVPILVVYLLAMVLPLPRMLGIMRDAALEDGGTGGQTYSAMLKGEAREGPDQRAYAQQNEQEEPISVAFKDFDLVAPPSMVHPANFGEVYAVVPRHSSANFLERVVENYKLFSEPVPADERLLPKQKPFTGQFNATKEAAEQAAQREKDLRERNRMHAQRALPGAFGYQRSMAPPGPDHYGQNPPHPAVQPMWHPAQYAQHPYGWQPQPYPSSTHTSWPPAYDDAYTYSFPQQHYQWPQQHYGHPQQQMVYHNQRHPNVYEQSGVFR